ncbi:MAG: acyl carrier protein [Candidatus Omnitrophica bacterium]|nr:acyl carrier protein [Candidatus Omnitrophota bacterium]
MRESIKAQLNKVFQKVFDDEDIQITDATAAKDIDQWDSLMHITLIVSIEKEFKVRFNTSEVGKLENVGQLINLLLQRLGK